MKPAHRTYHTARLWLGDPVFRPLRIAQSFASGDLRELLSGLTDTQARSVGVRAAIHIGTPRRFLRSDRLLRGNDALRGMLEVMRAGQKAAESLGVSVTLGLSERLPLAQPPRLFLSHHTFRTPEFDSLSRAGTRVLHFKAADLPRTFSIDSGGFSGWSSIADKALKDLDLPAADDPAVEQFYLESRAAITQANLSKYLQTATPLDEAPLPARFVFVALQTIGDLVQRHAFLPMLEMLDLVVRHYAGTGCHVVIKRHPKCKNRRVSAAIERALASSDRVHLTRRSIHDVLAKAEAVFTVNSGVGSEAMIYDLPICTFGGADYGAVTHRIRSAADLEALGTDIPRKVSRQDLMRFYFFYRNTYQIRRDHNLEERLKACFSTVLGEGATD